MPFSWRWFYNICAIPVVNAVVRYFRIVAQLEASLVVLGYIDCVSRHEVQQLKAFLRQAVSVPKRYL